MRPINIALIRMTRRAEKRDTKQLVESFVDVGSVFHSLDVVDHQVLYGRRGTGKTHILAYLADQKRAAGRVAVMLDMRTIGSSGGLYSDASVPLAERATRLLRDTLSALHDAILEEACRADPAAVDLSACGDALDDLISATGEISVEEKIEVERVRGQSDSFGEELRLGVIDMALDARFAVSSSSDGHSEDRVKQIGAPRLHINFGAVQRVLSRVVSNFDGKQLWLILDEWSEVPLDLQPYLADMLARTMFPVREITVKIAAIRQRARFRVPRSDGGYVGFEVGADVSAGIDLDENLVFENSPDAAREFFRNMLWKHVSTMEGPPEGMPDMDSPEAFVRESFTQVTALEELVRAAEGIPRDAINIIGIAANRAKTERVSVRDIRVAALMWYQSNKQNAISARPDAERLLAWIVDQVIKGKKARAFLVSADKKDSLIDFLYDARGIHLIKQNISGQDVAGARYNVFSLDYGLYVDLINTVSAPTTLLGLDDADDGRHVDVPVTDYRSIRRAVLDLDEFYNSF